MRRLSRTYHCVCEPEIKKPWSGRGGGNWTLRHGVQLPPLSQLLLNNHKAEDWIWEHGCGNPRSPLPCSHASKQARAAERWPPSYHCLSNLKTVHMFWRISFAIKPHVQGNLWAGRANWVLIHHTQHSKCHNFHMWECPAYSWVSNRNSHETGVTIVFY